MITTLKSILFFIIAGFFEIGGGYLIWLWLREGKGKGYIWCNRSPQIFSAIL